MLQLNLGVSQQHKIIPEKIQFLLLLHLNHLELEQHLSNILEENPFLEKAENDDESNNDEKHLHAEADYKDWDEYGYDDNIDYKIENGNAFAENTPQRQWGNDEDFRQHLYRQMSLLQLDERQKEIANFIIHSLNESGMLNSDIISLAEDLSFISQKIYSEQEVGFVVEQLRKLEPAGIATCNSRECLLEQLKRKNTRRPDVYKAIKLLDTYYEDLKKRNFSKICQNLQIDTDELTIIFKLISELPLRPIIGSTESEKFAGRVIPDFILTIEDEKPVVRLIKSYAESLFVNTNMNTANEKKAEQYYKNKIKSAQWYVQALKQRENTMLKIVTAIIDRQKEYFLEYGNEKYLKPMILKHIAEETGTDISTVSRITSNRYIDTPFGSVLLKKLFTEALVNDEGVSCSNILVKKTIADLINSEDKKHPYTDPYLVKILESKGYKISRRTVTKYREMMNIPVSYLRCNFSIAS